jgi:Bacterial Ig-like domain (group 3)/MBG domain (YGX type)
MWDHGMRTRSLQRLASGALLCFAAILPTQTVTPYVLWNTPAPTVFPTPLSGLQLNALVLAGPPVPVPLASSYNLLGIAADGTTFAGTQGLDGGGRAFSANLVGNSVTWNGVIFALGPANANDAVINGVSVPVPSGNYSYLLMLADMVDQVTPQATFIVNYSGGGRSPATRTLSDWVIVKATPGESRVACWPYRVTSAGGKDSNSVCMDGYAIPLDPTRTLLSVTVPNGSNYPVLSMVLLPAVVAGAGSYNPPFFVVTPVGTNALDFTFMPTSAAYTNVSGSVSLVTTAPSPPIVPVMQWPAPAPVLLGTALSAAQLNATVVATGRATPVLLTDNTNVDVIFDDGTAFSHGGFDSNKYVYSAQQLGGKVAYAGMQFALGARNVPDAVTSATLQPVASNDWTGQYAMLYLIGAAANSAQPAQNFTVTYSDGTNTTQAISMSSWQSPQSFPGETIVASTTYANTSAGGRVAGTFDLYGYRLALDPAKIVTGIVLPDNADVIVLAAALGPAQALNVTGNFVYSPPAGTVLPLGNNPLAVSFTPNDTVDFAPATGTSSLLVYQPTLVIEADNATRLYGTPNPLFTGSITGRQNGDKFTESFSTPATTLSSAGTYAITPSASGANLAVYAQTFEPGVLTITRAPVTLTLTANTVSALHGASVTLTATVGSTTSGTPTGAVTFLCNGTLIGTATLAAGTGTLTASTLPLGSDTITANYSGDVDFLPDATGGNSVSINIAQQDFTLSAPGGTTLSTLYGGSTQLLLHIAPLNGTYSSDVVFTLSGELALGAAASFSPNPVPVNGGATDVTLTIHTLRLSASSTHGWKDVSGIALAFLLLPFVASGRIRRKRRWGVVLGLAMLAGAISLGGCGTGYAAHAFPATVTATSGTVQHSLQVTLQMEAGPQ